MVETFNYPAENAGKQAANQACELTLIQNAELQCKFLARVRLAVYAVTKVIDWDKILILTSTSIRITLIKARET